MKKNKQRFHRIPRRSVTALLVAAVLGVIGQSGYAQTIPAEYRWWAINSRAYNAHIAGPYLVSGQTYTPASTTGRGITVAVVDTGVIRHIEFNYTVSGVTKSRVLAGADFVSTTGGDGTNDGNGHGTHVAGIVAAGRGNGGIVGIAPDAWILPIRVLNNAGSGTWSGINSAIAWATGTNGYARQYQTVFNMSLGGSVSSTSVFSNIKNAGSIGVVAAGNDGLNITSSMFAYHSVGSGAVGNSIIVGAVDSANKIASFSNKPGELKNGTVLLSDYFIVAPGVSIYSTYKNGGYATMSGTSMATPMVSGAAAVVWGAWPYLSAGQVVQSLLLSANRSTSVIPDYAPTIYGRGLLDVEAAMRPVNGYCYTYSSLNTSCTNTSTKLNTSGTSNGSATVKAKSFSTPAAAGFAAYNSSASILGYDGLGRHFFFPVGAALRAGGINATHNMDAWMAKGQPVTQVANTGAIRFSIQGDPNAGITGFSYRQDATDNSYVMAFKGSGVVPFGLAHTDFRANAFVSGDNMRIPYLGLMESPVGMAYGRELGNGLSFRVGQLVGGAAANRTVIDMTAPYMPVTSSSAMLAEASQKLGPVQLIATFGSMREDGSFLGASSSGRTTQGNTSFSTISSIVDLGAGISAMGSLTRGQSRGLTGDGVADFNTKTEASSFGLLKAGVFAEKDQLAISLSMPSRVTSGGVTLNAGVDVNMETGAPIYGQIPVSLAPQGRERRWELSWSTPIKSGNVALTALRRLEPNHNAAAPAENIVGARLTKSF